MIAGRITSRTYSYLFYKPDLMSETDLKVKTVA